MNRRVLGGIGVAAAATIGTAWFLSNFERVPAREWVGMSGEARLRPFLAAERFADRMGLPAKELRSAQEFDGLPAGAVLLLPNGRQVLDAPRLARVMAWVEGGGHLVVEPEVVGVADPLLDALSVQRAADTPRGKPLSVELPGSDRKLSVLLDSPIRLVTAAPGSRLLFRVGPPAAAKLVALARGRGTVTVAATLAFARNQRIGDNDNAEFFWRILDPERAKGLRVFFSPERLSLWNFLVEHAAEALAAVAGLVGLWLWRIGPRFGPLAADPPPGRRRLLDHLRASGRYFWANGPRERLITAAREAALRRIARAHPDFPAAPPAEQAARLATLAGVTVEDAARLIDARGAERATDFVLLTRTAQRVHAAL